MKENGNGDVTFTLLVDFVKKIANYAIFSTCLLFGTPVMN